MHIFGALLIMLQVLYNLNGCEIKDNGIIFSANLTMELDNLMVELEDLNEIIEKEDEDEDITTLTINDLNIKIQQLNEWEDKMDKLKRKMDKLVNTNNG